MSGEGVPDMIPVRMNTVIVASVPGKLGDRAPFFRLDWYPPDPELPGFTLIDSQYPLTNAALIYAAVRNAGLPWPSLRMVGRWVDGRPLDSLGDLPMVMGVLVAAGAIERKALDGFAFAAEVSISGRLGGVRSGESREMENATIAEALRLGGPAGVRVVSDPRADCPAGVVQCADIQAAVAALGMSTGRP